jgi:hypothetical protein
MTPDELSGSIDSIITKADAAFGKTVTSTQQALFEQMQLLLNRLELKPDGTIMQNRANRELLAKVDVYFNKAFNESGYYNQLNGFTGDITKITSENVAYFAFVEESFSANAQYIKSLQKQTVTQFETLLANDGLTAILKNPLNDILNQNINTGAAYSDLLSQVRGFILGTPERQGQLMRYSRQIVNDTLFNFNRALQESISEQAGLQWYLYSGGIRADSRPFCVARHGKYFHKDEVEAWAKLGQWDGRRAGTTSSTIFIYAGGYFCGHQLIAVSEKIVPKSIRERVK